MWSRAVFVAAIAMIMCVVVGIACMISWNITKKPAFEPITRIEKINEINTFSQTVSDLPVCDRDAAVWEWAREGTRVSASN